VMKSAASKPPIIQIDESQVPPYLITPHTSLTTPQ
jgi:hypothetical protein